MLSTFFTRFDVLVPLSYHSIDTWPYLEFDAVTQRFLCARSNPYMAIAYLRLPAAELVFPNTSPTRTPRRTGATRWLAGTLFQLIAEEGLMVCGVKNMKVHSDDAKEAFRRVIGSLPHHGETLANWIAMAPVMVVACWGNRAIERMLDIADVLNSGVGEDGGRVQKVMYVPDCWELAKSHAMLCLRVVYHLTLKRFCTWGSFGVISHHVL
ncbi:hypothetical protein BC829DRAFT_254918 [Chytridium lagenaria]|nr:hypothetical protein BC829DRAFT_254918 [Chytridium lagenaria]